MLTHFSLFSGIGGIDLAAEWAGFTTVGQCEWADYPTKVLEKHWPDVPRWRDIRDVTNESVRERIGGGKIFLLSGGFPCQPFSVAGKQKGKEDNRYLWPEMLRVIRELTPSWVIGENVPGILRIAGKEVCEDLEREGYAVTVFNFEAAAVGANHRRERIFFVGHSKHHGCITEQKLRSHETPSNERWKEEQEKARESEGASRPFDVSGLCGCEDGSKQNVENSRCSLRQGSIIKRTDENEIREGNADLHKRSSGASESDVADSDSEWQLQQKRSVKELGGWIGNSSKDVANTTSERWEESRDETRNTCEGKSEWESWAADGVNGHIWKSEPNVGRVANGIPNRVDRLKCLGNAVVPQQVYPILKAIAEIESREA